MFGERLADSRHDEPPRSSLTREEHIYFLAKMHEDMDMAFAITEMDGRFIACNRAFCLLTGYAMDELSVKTWKDITPTDWHGIEPAIDSDASKGKVLQYEKEYIRKDGSKVPVEVLVRKYIDENGEQQFYYLFVMDISGRKRVEEALREREANLADARDQAELYLDLMGHDINNMNQVALGYLEMASGIMDKEGMLDKEHRSLITKPMEMLRGNSTLISNVRKLQRGRAGDHKSQVIDLDKMLAEVASQFSGVEGRDVTMSLDTCTCRVEANELLRDVFQNLVGNAIEHSEGDLSICIKAVDVEEDGRLSCRVSVEDNGPGISDDIKKGLFKRSSFKRTRASGKGFGLCLARMLVEDFGGKIWVEDRVPGDYGQGCRFVVILPSC
jgi:PAS domain S-box-containing protein